MSTWKVTLHSPPPGYLAEAEYRKPLEGEDFIDGNGRVARCVEWLEADGVILGTWLSRTDFRGFVYSVCGSDIVRAHAIGWIDSYCVLHDQPMGLHCCVVRPVAVLAEVEE